MAIGLGAATTAFQISRSFESLNITVIAEAIRSKLKAANDNDAEQGQPKFSFPPVKISYKTFVADGLIVGILGYLTVNALSTHNSMSENKKDLIAIQDVYFAAGMNLIIFFCKSYFDSWFQSHKTSVKACIGEDQVEIVLRKCIPVLSFLLEKLNV